jgi:hypothetical protein
MEILHENFGKIDLNEGILIEVDGEYGKYNTMPIDGLISLAQNLQNLIDAIVKVDLEAQETLDLQNFRIELSGYYKNSSVPEFVFTKRIQTTVGDTIERQREIVNNKIGVILNISNSGNYLLLNDIYKVPQQRTPIVSALFDFAHSCGTSPISIVDKVKDGFSKKYEIGVFKKEVKDKLISRVVEEPGAKESTMVCGLVKVTKNKNKEQKKLVETFSNTQVSLSYATNKIVFQDRIYNLVDQLSCVYEKIDNYYSIKHDMLGIIGTGETESEAIESFSEEFDYAYNRYNELNDDQLTERLKFIKLFLNHLVITQY